MEIEVRLFANLRRHLPPGNDGFGFRKTMSGETRVSDIVDELGLPPDLPVVLIVNGRQSALDHELQDGDVLSIFPPVGGG